MMKTLEEHNEEIQALHNKATKKAGVTCPNCNLDHIAATEMLLADDPRNAILTSSPPQQAVRCPQCRHNGYKLI